MNRELVIARTREQAQWWAEQRVNKFLSLSNETMSINPFLIPLIPLLNGLESSGELVDFIIGGYLSSGYNTGFGKLIDEKILPNVFNTEKLSRQYRRDNNLINPMFDEIDHVVTIDGVRNYLSLKASKWTIQLTMAVQLNRSFCEIIDNYDNFNNIVIGVFYGKRDELTDKYDIACGICNGATHDVRDITNRVNVLAGKEFWAWINEGEEETQQWVLQGLLEGVATYVDGANVRRLMVDYKQNFERELSVFYNNDSPDWNALLQHING